MGDIPDRSDKTTEHLNINHWSEFRRISYSTYGGADRISDWISLEGGRKYYIESAHLNGWGGSHFSMGVEIEQEVLNPAHPNNVKEVQKLSFNTKDQREQHTLTITNPNIDTGTFYIQFTTPKLDKSISEAMKPNMSGSEIRDRIKKNFNSVGVNTIV